MRKILLIVLMCMSGRAIAQITGEFTTIDIRNNDEFEGFGIIDTAVRNARLIMTGENHMYVKFNSKMELKMLRYLNKKLGLRNFIIELGEARAHFLNRYILNPKDTAATNYLRATTSPRYMDLFNRLRSYNASLPDSMKIHVYGIDVERFNDLPLMRLSELLPRDGIPADIRVGVESVIGASEYMLHEGLVEYEKARDESRKYDYSYRTAPFYINPTIIEFVRYFDSLNPVFRNWLGDKYAEVEQAVGWLREYDQWNAYENTTFQYIWREENIYRHLVELMRSKNGERFYGQFGRCHVAYDEQNGECGWYGYHSVMNKMRTRYFKNYDSVLTIGIFYAGGIDQSRYYSDRESDKDVQREVAEIIDNAESKKITIFNLKDDDADMPLLSKKFSFAIVNRSIDLEFEDTVVNEVITKASEISSTFQKHQYVGYGYTLTSISLQPLGNYAADHGYSTYLGNVATHNIVWGMVGNKFDNSFQYSFMPSFEVHDGDSGLVQYGVRKFTFRTAYCLKNTNRFSVSLGGNFGYGKERIHVANSTASFLAASGDRDYENPAWVAGVSARVEMKFAKILFLGLSGGKDFDLGNKQWYYKGSSQAIGANNEISHGLGGYFISAYIGFLIDTPDYDYSDYSE